MKFRKALRILTKDLGSQSAVALRLAVNRSTVSRWVNRETRPDKRMRAVVKFLAEARSQ